MVKTLILNLSELREAATRLHKNLSKFGNIKKVKEEILEACGEVAKNTIKNNISEMKEEIRKKVIKPAIFMNKWRRITEAQYSMQDLKVTGSLYSSITTKIENNEVKIGLFKEKLNIKNKKWYERKPSPSGFGESRFTKQRTAEEGLMIAATTLEYGSTVIHIPDLVRSVFDIQKPYFFIEARNFLSMALNTENKEAIIDVVKEKIKSIVYRKV